MTRPTRRPHHIPKSRKLTEDQVREIKALRHHVLARELAEHYGVNPSVIRFIWNGENYRHVGPE
jgi:hypothetical protein